MRNEFHLAVLVVLFLTLHIGTKARYCKDVNYVTIKDARRSTAYILPHNSSSNKLCDRKAIMDDVWYRFSSEAGGDMATRRPNRGGCGTRAPIWMNGTHPTVEEGIVKRKACLDAPLVIPLGCGYSYDINVRNCSGYYIYQLKTPSQCDSVYCAGSKLPNCSNADPEDYCLANRPPYITMPDRLYAVENSTFQLVINGTDPERYPLTYEVSSSVNISIVSYDKAQKKVQIFASKSGSISLKVIDYEDLAANHTISIQVVSCPCQNGGTCRSNKNVSANLEEVSNFTCTCLKSFSGRLCENIDQCRNLPCFPRVNCSVTGDKYYTCGKCPPSMEGDGRNCKLILPNDAVAVVLTMTIISGLSWNDDLLNKTSFIYKETTAEIEIQIIKAYSDTKQFLNVIVNSYRKGSVLVVEFQIVLKKMINDAKYDPVKLLRSLAKQNKFGRFTVEPHSVRKKGTCRNSNHKNVTKILEEVSNVTCTCVKSYSGRLCENIDQCRNLPCFPRVNCSETGDNCGKCPPGMEGDGRNCKLILRDDAVAVVLTMTIVSGLPWNDDLLNKTSFVYKETTAEIEIQIIKAYSDTKEFINVIVNSYRKGSVVVVEFQIVLKKMINDAKYDPVKLLRSFAKQNKFGRFTVEPHSVRKKGSCRNNNHKNVTKNLEEVSNFTCTCVKSYSGRLCENIDHCRNLPCFPRVNCSVTGDKYYTCGKCPPSMEGDGWNCKLILRDGAVAVVLTMTIISGLPWNDDLLNKTSFVYKETTAEIEIQIIKAYSDTKDFLNVMVKSYRRGSVVVEFQIVSKKAMKDPLKPLRNCVNQNKFGRFTVDPQSVTEKTTKSADDTYFGLKKAVFIAIMCIVSLLVIISIAICGICIGKKHISVVLINISDGQEREICPDGTKESGLQMKTRLSRNQVLPT